MNQDDILQFPASEIQLAWAQTTDHAVNKQISQI